jgi:hypothetical protein
MDAIRDIRKNSISMHQQARNLVEEFFPEDIGTTPNERHEKH